MITTNDILIKFETVNSELLQEMISRQQTRDIYATVHHSNQTIANREYLSVYKKTI